VGMRLPKATVSIHS